MNLKSIPTAFSSNEVTERLLKEIMEIRGNNSKSSIIRDAIFEYRKTTKPLYLDEKVAGKVKAIKLKELEKQADQTPEELATEIKAPIVTDSEGNKFVRIRGMSNQDRIIKLADFKEVIKREEWILNTQREFITGGGVIPAEMLGMEFII
jgi:uncharacterized protein (UPF0216 family)